MLRRSGAMVLHSVRLAGLYVHLVRMRLAIGDGWWFIECALKLLCSGVDRRERRRSVGVPQAWRPPPPPCSVVILGQGTRGRGGPPRPVPTPTTRPPTPPFPSPS